MSGGTAYGKDIIVRLLRRVTSTTSIKVNAAIVRANICQGGMHTAADSLRNHGIQLEAGHVKTKCQLGIRPAGVEHDITKSPTGDGQHCQLVTHFQHLLVHSYLLLLIREHPCVQP